jgi:MinD superfamily P-loop ATPase
VKEVVVISGKGGTGKTSLVASFAALAGDAVLADCDVDAADLHLILAPNVREHHEFKSGHEAVIRKADCTGCGACFELCRFGAVQTGDDTAGETRFSVNPTACEGCGVCVRFCPAEAIDFPERVCGEWFVSTTRFGPMVHARLGIAAENSGKLVSIVRKTARQVAEREGRSLILVDGPPGIGCPVIASITGATAVLAVTEPTLSGEHDLSRVLSLTRHFGIPTAVCVNKWDINPKMAEQIEGKARRSGATLAARIPYDRAFTDAMIQGKTVVEHQRDGAVAAIRRVWSSVSEELACTRHSGKRS